MKVITVILVLMIAFIISLIYMADQVKPKYEWEGYWGICNDEEYPDLKPFGFFHTHIENWGKAGTACSIENIQKAKADEKYDILQVQCTHKKLEPYDMVLRLHLNLEGQLLLAWPSGVYFKMPKCEIKN